MKSDKVWGYEKIDGSSILVESFLNSEIVQYPKLKKVYVWNKRRHPLIVDPSTNRAVCPLIESEKMPAE